MKKQELGSFITTSWEAYNSLMTYKADIEY